MTARVDILDEQEPLKKPFWGSVTLHISIAALLLSYSYLGLGKSNSPPLFGDPHGGGLGSVAVNVVPSIKLPSREGRENPVANQSESSVPEPKPQKKAVEKVKAPEPDAIPIKSKAAKKQPREVASAAPNTFREKQHDAPNQLTSTVGQSLTSRMLNMQGGGGLQIGNDSPFGQQFGAYAKLLRDRVASKWQSSEFDSRQSIQPAVVSFTIRRDGSLAPGSVKITGSSGNPALDISAQRAIYDAAPFPPLPNEFTKNEAQVELRFNLK